MNFKDKKNQFFKEAINQINLGKLDDAKDLINKILEFKPEDFDSLNLLGIIFFKKHNYTKSIEIIKKLIKIYPNNEIAYFNLGNVFVATDNNKNAISNFKKAVEINPNFVEALTNLGKIFLKDNSLDNAEKYFLRVLKLNPKNAYIYFEIGNILMNKNFYEEAIKNFNIAIGLKKDFLEAFNNLGLAQCNIGMYSEAINSIKSAISLRSSYAEAYNNLGTIYLKLKDFEKALINFTLAKNLKVDYFDAVYNLASTFLELKKYNESIENFNLAKEINSDADFLISNLIHAKLSICDWENLKDLKNELENKNSLNKKSSTPFNLLGIFDNPKMHLECSNAFINSNFKVNNFYIFEKKIKNKIKVGYFSSDYYNHATMYLIAELFEQHDKKTFETYGFSFGPKKKDFMKGRAINALDKFFNVEEQSDFEIVKLARKQNLDIAIDLKGHTQNSKMGIFFSKVAPIQCSYLGYPGTAGGSFIDYLIADKVVIPDDQRKFYSEKIIYMPDSYQVNDGKRLISKKPMFRKDFNLPENSFVFCNFNSNWKILPEIFETWINILDKVKNSVLWLLEDNKDASENLLKFSKSKNFDIKRIIFAKKLPNDQHLARLQLANLSLDTFPYGAHTTASDALYVKLPLITLIGKSFQTRVGSSLLKCLKLEELITKSLIEYTDKAVEIALNKKKYFEIKDKLINNHKITKLFDSISFAKNIEKAYKIIFKRYVDNLSPDHIIIDN